ncbi:unnamed protein product [Brassica oleracea var. botrytis]
MLKLTKQDAAAQTLDEMNVGGSEELPQCLKELAGKYFVFQIRVKPFNFTPNHRTFTVCAIVNHINPRFSIPMKHHLFKRKVANHPHLSLTSLGVKPMNHIYPVLKAKRVAVNAPAIEVTKLLSVNPSLLLCLYNFRTYFAFPISDAYIFFSNFQVFFCHLRLTNSMRRTILKI